MTTMQEKPAEKVRVPHPDDMDTDILCKHINARHADGLPEGYKLDPEFLDPYVEECWRRWHERMHRLTVFTGSGFSVPEFDHTHKDPQ